MAKTRKKFIPSSRVGPSRTDYVIERSSAIVLLLLLRRRRRYSQFGTDLCWHLKRGSSTGVRAICHVGVRVMDVAPARHPLAYWKVWFMSEESRCFKIATGESIVAARCFAYWCLMVSFFYIQGEILLSQILHFLQPHCFGRWPRPTQLHCGISPNLLS